MALFFKIIYNITGDFMGVKVNNTNKSSKFINLLCRLVNDVSQIIYNNIVLIPLL